MPIDIPLETIRIVGQMLGRGMATIAVENGISDSGEETRPGGVFRGDSRIGTDSEGKDKEGNRPIISDDFGEAVGYAPGWSG